MRAFVAVVVAGVSIVSAGGAWAQGTAQPPPGYPPASPGAGYPADPAQPPPGYPPTQQPPPPGYPPAQQPPQPGYAPASQQPGYQQPYPAAAPAPAPRKGLLFLPYLGFESHRGSHDEGLGPGAVLGALIGGRLNPMFSINLEITGNILNPKNDPNGEITVFEGDLVLSPLVHVPVAPNFEIVAGPKIGVFGGSLQASGFKETATGFAIGLNLGAFFAVAPTMSVGGLIAFTVRDAHEVCTTSDFGLDNCDSTSDFFARKVLGFNAALLF